MIWSYSRWLLENLGGNDLDLLDNSHIEIHLRKFFYAYIKVIVNELDWKMSKSFI